MTATTKPTINQALRAIAGGFVILSVALAQFVSPWFLLFTVFVGLNLLQSAFSGWCPMMSLLARLGFRREVAATGFGAPDARRGCC